MCTALSKSRKEISFQWLTLFIFFHLLSFFHALYCQFIFFKDGFEPHYWAKLERQRKWDKKIEGKQAQTECHLYAFPHFIWQVLPLWMFSRLLNLEVTVLVQSLKPQEFCTVTSTAEQCELKWSPKLSQRSSWRTVVPRMHHQRVRGEDSGPTRGSSFWP